MEELKNKLLKITTNKLIKNTIGNSLDTNFIEDGKLTWLPWIGENYTRTKTKMLIVGESHYYDPASKNDYSFIKHQKIDFTQTVVKEIAITRNIDDKRSATMYENFYRSIHTVEQSREDYWNSVAFYNFIQQPMHSIKQRPNQNMIAKAWNSFKSVIEILEPDFVIFIGVKCCEGFNEFAKDINSSLKVDSEFKISNRQIPRSASIVLNSKIIPVHFIKHSSSYYSGSKWRTYFERKGIIKK